MPAAYEGYTEIAKLLIQAGAELNAKTTREELFGKKWKIGTTALSIAKQEGNDDIVQLLLEAGAEE